MIKLVIILKKIKLEKIISLLDFLFISLCIWVLLIAGTNIQFYIFKLINSDSNSVYGSVFENAIAKFGNLKYFISYSLSFSDNAVLFAALFIALSSIFFKRSMQIFIYTIISSVIFISIFDCLYQYLYNNLTTQSLLENITANLLGSPIIAAYVVLLYYIKSTVLKIAGINIAIRHIASYFAYTALSLMIIVMTYYVICFFYRPTSMNFMVTTQGEMSGDYFPDQDAAKKKKDNFSFFTTPIILNKNFKLLGTIDNIELFSDDHEKTNLQIKFYENCTTIPKNINYDSNTLTLESVNKFKLQPTGDYSIVEFDDTKGLVKQDDDLVNIFRATLQKNKNFDFQKVTNGAVVYYPSKEGGAIFINSTLLPKKSELISDNHYNIHINGTNNPIRISRANINHGLVYTCEELDPTRIINSKTYISDKLFNFGVLINIKPQENNYFFMDGNNNELSLILKGEALHTYGKNIKADSFTRDFFKDGYMSGFILHNINKLIINEKMVETTIHDSILVMGKDIYANVSNDHNIVIRGSASTFYKNNIRLNRTLWEYASENTLFLSGIGTILFALLAWTSRKLISIIRKNEIINHF
ncbi:TPA: hypothetical protein ACYX8M_000063 [Klebsiella pneumoniae]